MAKQLNVNLAFSADTSRAKTQIMELQKALNSLSSTAGLGKDLPITGEIMEAQVAAKQLSAALGEAFNMDTGKLDLAKFSKNLSDSKMTLSDYSQKLTMLGKEGDQAFLKVASSIVSTEAPLKRSSTLLTEMGTTLKNTIRWQLSSSILHGFMGAIKGAYGYAQDLNKSLNDIRIVTGQSTEQMADFAKNANKAAKELSTTTTAYTNAALIYYQQGNDDATVLEKTDVTAKMANVTGTSAQAVSDQLTAIWNNFNASGEESYEKYADVLTALGAATASSTDEIAGGLEKFASVADMIGLSYEYAASALATITATTRQSEDVVGTALKTIFARIQGLNLGETLDDGTTLNKYSEALSKVGISIKDSAGNLKDMDTILNEMGSKWQTISKDQQVALAQTVAGVRQYNQLVSLMNNWDFMQENLDIANNAEGTLDKQSEIYAESWEAASKRVQASLETIYMAILKDDFFIGLTNGFSVIIEGVDGLIDSLGGVKGVIALLGTVLTSVFQEQMTAGINNALYNFTRFTGVAQQEMQKMQQEAYETAMAMTKDMDSPSTEALRKSLQGAYELQIQLRDNIKNMTPEQAESARQAMELAKHYGEVAIEVAKAAEKAEELYNTQKAAASNKYGAGAQSSINLLNDKALESSGSALTQSATDMMNQIKAMNSSIDTTGAQNALEAYRKALREFGVGSQEAQTAANGLITALDGLATASQGSTQAFTDFETKAKNSATSVVAAQVQYESFREEVMAMDGAMDVADSEPLVNKIKNLTDAAAKAGIDVGDVTKALREFNAAMKSGDATKQQQALNNLVTTFRTTAISADKATDAIIRQSGAFKKIKDAPQHYRDAANGAREYEVKVQGVAASQEKLGQEVDKAKKKIEQQGLAYKTLGSAITGTVQGLSSFAMAISSLISLQDTLSDESLSGFEKALRITTTFGMVVPSLTMGLTSMGKAWRFATSKDIAEGLTAQIAKLFGVKLSVEAGTVAINKDTGAKTLNTKATWKAVAANLAYLAPLGLIVLGIAAITAALTIASNMYNADAIAAEKAAEAAKNASEEFSKAQSAYDDFKSTMDDYTNGINGLKELTKGTEEYREALLKANEAAMELIETGNLVYGKDWKTVDGVIEISRDAMKTAREAQLETLESAAGYKAFAKQNSRNASLKEKETEFNREYAKGKGWGKENTAATVATGGLAAGGALLGTGISAAIAIKAGTAIGTAIAPGVGTAIGAAVGGAIGIITLGVSQIKKTTDEESKALRVLQAEYEKVGSNSVFTAEQIRDTLQKYGGFSDDLINSLAESNTETQKMVIALSENTAAIYASIEQNASNANRDNEDYKNLSEEDKALADKIIARKGSSVMADQNSEEYKKAYREAKATFNGWDTQETYSEYLKARFGDNANNYRVTDMGGKNATLQRINAEGTWENVGEKNGLSNDEVINYLTQNKLSQYNKDTMQSEINSINQTGNYLQGISSTFTDDIITSIKGNLASGEAIDLSLLSPEQIRQLETELTETGDKISDTHAKAISDAIDKYDITDYQNRMEQEVKAIDDRYEGEAEKQGLDVDEFKAYRGQVEQRRGFENDSGENHADEWLDKLETENVAEYEEALNQLAITQARLDRGYDSLASNWEDWNEILSDSNADIGDVAEVMSELNGVIADIIDWDLADVELLPSNFGQKYRKEIQDVYDGVDGAVEKLAGLATYEYMIAVGIDDSELSGEALDAYNTLTNVLQDMPDLEVGMSLNDTPMYDALQTLLDSGAITAEQMTNILSQIGFEPEVTTKKVTLDSEPYEVDGKTWVDVIDPITGEKTRVSGEYAAAGQAVGETIEIPAINGEATVYRGGGGSTQKSPSKRPSGGGGSKPKKTADSRKDRDEIVDRYKEINDQLEETQRLMKKNNTLADGLYGAKRFAKLKENIKLMEQENKQLKEKYQLTLDYLEEDRSELEDVARAAGVSFKFENDIITNYTTEMTDLYNRRESLLDSFGDEMNEKEQERLEEFDKKIEALKKAYEQYEKTLDEKKDAEEEHLEKILEIQTAYYDLLNEELEVKISLNDDALSVLEYYLGKMSDDFYQMAEAAAFMLNGVNDDGKSQYQISKSNLEHQKNYIDELEKDHSTINPETGETYINDAQYVEGLRNSRDAMIEELNALKELDDTMMNYYGDTIAMAQEELAKYTDQMDHHTSVLEHYQTILELTGKQNDYEALGVVLEGQAETAENRVKVAEAEMNMYKEQVDLRWQDYQNALKRGDKAAAELHLKEYEAALAAANEAEENYLSSAEEWAESLRAVLENTMKGLAQDLENILTGGTSFTQMTTAMERAASLQEEYLTTTNQIYETNKLMRTAQQEIDKSTNSVAKRKLKQFINETEQMQNQSKLSKYELDIQQAKYDLLLAEIALEEAQNAKSTVRLQRSSDGSFGYVYTADQSAVDQAEQELLDKQNALYNIGLEGANDYAQKYQQTLNEMYDAITELQQQKLDGMFETEEEYQNAVMATKEYYYQKLSDYSHLYSIALTTDSAVVEDAWSTDFNSMIYNTDKWQKSVNEYIEEVQRELTDYETKMQQVAEKTVGKNLAEIKKKTKEVTDENKKLVEKITDPSNGVIKAITDEMNSVASLTGKYANLRSEIQSLISTYERMLGKINQDIDTTVNNPSSPSSNPGNNNGGDDSGKKQQAKAIAKEASEIVTKVHNGTIKQTSSGWKPSAREMGYSENAISVAAQAFNDSKSGGGYDYCYEKALKLVGLDTGGYTGDWEGSYGKLALLHKKELVLNEHDTENFLTGIDLLNKIISIIDLQSISSQLGGILSSPSLGNINNDETLEQQVHIEASFPNVQDRNEIEEAFNNLINKASQYAHRK